MNYLIVGGNSAIGKELLQKLLDNDNECWAVSRSQVEIHHPRLHVIERNVLEEDLSPDELPDTLNGLVYLPGTITLKPFRMLKPEDYISDYEINFLGAVKCIKSALKPLGKGYSASIVMLSTVAVQTGLPFHASIAAAKGAVEGLTRSLAAEFAPKIRVNCIAPSLTDTPLASKLLSSDQKRQSSEERHPLKTIGKPEDIAEAIVFLLGSTSRWVTGQVIGVDGGLSALKV